MLSDTQRLIEAGRLAVGTELYHRPRAGAPDIVARVRSDGIDVGGTTYRSLSTAAGRLAGHATNGWTYWRLRETGRPIAELRAGAQGLSLP